MLAMKQLMLGEQLPPLSLILRDACGNAVPLEDKAAPEVSVALLLPLTICDEGAPDHQQHGLEVTVCQVSRHPFCLWSVIHQIGANSMAKFTVVWSAMIYVIFQVQER